ncbi:glycosyltransferase family 2 protein [Bifidobacterium gallicum]|uniref:Glycosyl transferase family 2 n=1 Tax=Bifidobacterium gallicum DSM 20093 = LMG 11596 TaxID=561180 RepID=D1NWT3_9BIFI|nr:glycosyltransferase family 2 protein [Bifidobacterium gallicum]EFA22142.1 hypothetical protein BIFGAL_04339 [Bifidobacterium gallicum DSM 20093 = LMG 11596]KFI57483.1 glycosyl transferase family 2 [Bifidobacterium gallicum DSM 20093 = LMG 11596]
MTSSGTTEIQQIIGTALASKTFAHCNRVEDNVSAVITVERDMRFLPYTVEAVFSQTVLPASIIIADCSGQTTQGRQLTFDVTPIGEGALTEYPQSVPINIEIVPVSRAHSFGDAVTKAIRNSSTNPARTALWLLHDDSRPADDQCLEHLLEAWAYTPTAAILGAKQMDWDATRLYNVGAYAAHHAVRSLVVDGEPDQEQYDGRSDVFTVSLAGAFIPPQTLQDAHGIDPWFTTYREGDDLCRRLCLGGKRVVVVPQARIAHRRSRFEGVRTQDGRPLTTMDAVDPSLHVLSSQQKYWFTDLRIWLWPFAWLGVLCASLFFAVRALFRKRPYRACCHLLMPWLAIIGIPGACTARRHITRQTKVPASALQPVSANHAQLRQWKTRMVAFDNQRNASTLSPLVVQHLRTRAIRRWTIALVAAALSFVMIVALYWPIFRAAWSDASLFSNTLLPTGATFSQLVDAATTPWVFGLGTGVPAPPMPWLLVLMVCSLFTGGHVAAALSLILFLAAPVMVMSFWALAGVVTRSDIVRTLSSLLWFGLALALGLFAQANLVMLTVFMVLPAAFALTFKAVGMYRTEQPVNARASVQCAALSALLFMVAVCAEPQLLLALIVIFMAFLLFVRRSRVMLVLIPFPAAFAVAPTLINAIRYADLGLWRQLFGDMMMPDATSLGRSSAPSAQEVVMRAFGLPSSPLAAGQSWSAIAGVILIAMFMVLAFIAVLTLVRPSIFRPSRILWTVIVCGVLLSITSASVVVGVTTSGVATGSVLPGMALVGCGVLTAVAMMAGPSIPVFKEIADGKSAHSAGATAVKTVISLIMVLAMAVMGYAGVDRAQTAGIGLSSQGLPMVAQDYLSDSSDRRVLALAARTMTSVEYAVMHTSRGDLIDASAAYRVREAFGEQPTADEDRIAQLSANLLANADEDALQELSSMGFGGLYVARTGGAPISGEATEQLVSNITSSGEAKSVVDNDEGTYFRLASLGDATHGVDTAWQQRTQSSAWRIAWLWCLGIIVALYIVVAIPRRRNGMEDNA